MPANQHSHDGDDSLGLYSVSISVTYRYMPSVRIPGTSLFVPPKIEMTVEVSPIAATFHLTVEVRDVVRITSFTFESPNGMTPAELNRIDFNRWVEEGLHTCAWESENNPVGSDNWTLTPPENNSCTNELKKFISKRPRKPKDKKRLQEVAKIYKDAQREGQETGKAVAGKLSVSKVYARELIYEARKAGLLPPTTRNKTRKKAK